MFAKKILPITRAYIAFTLVNKHGLSQFKVARLLGMKQPAVNYLVRRKRGAKYMVTLENTPELKKMLDNLAKTICDSGIFDPCELCRMLRRNTVLLKHMVELLDEKSFIECRHLIES